MKHVKSCEPRHDNPHSPRRKVGVGSLSRPNPHLAAGAMGEVRPAFYFFVCLLAYLALFTAPTHADTANWPHPRGGIQGTGVAQATLADAYEPAWTFKAGAAVLSSAIVVDGVVYVGSQDKKLYALRDVTATIESIPMIAGSIMSKKLASGSDAIVLDVKSGSGAFMKTPDRAFALARELVSIGEGLGKSTVAVITDMEQPLGRTVGNAIEVQEAVETLRGRGPVDLTELCLELGAHMLVLAGKFPHPETAKAELHAIIESGRGLDKLKQFVERQGGDPRQVEDVTLLPQAKFSATLNCPKEGFVTALEAETVGMAAMLLGAGREMKEAPIDPAAGIRLHRKLGEKTATNEPLATLYSNDENKLQEGLERLARAYQIGKQPPATQPLIHGHVDREQLKQPTA